MVPERVVPSSKHWNVSLFGSRKPRFREKCRDYRNPTRERGTLEGRRRERRKSIPRLRFGLRRCHEKLNLGAEYAEKTMSLVWLCRFNP